MKRFRRIVFRLIDWAALSVACPALGGFCFGIGLGLVRMRYEGDWFDFVFRIAFATGVFTGAARAWLWMVELVRRVR